MKAWERIKDSLDELTAPLDAIARRTDFIGGELSGAPAPPQNNPALSPDRGDANTVRAPRRRRPLADGEVDIHLRLRASHRSQLERLRKERGVSMSALIADLVWRGLEEPRHARREPKAAREARAGMIEEAALACLLAIEQTRLILQKSMLDGDVAAYNVLDAAAVAAEDRMTTARRALGRPDE